MSREKIGTNSSGVGRKEDLLAELAGQREALIQACWAHQIWSTPKLTTAGGQPVQVLFPGWLNRGEGPDFKDARVLIGGDEHFGSVEIHMNEGDWYSHGHHEDAAYENVVLHVVLHRSERAASTQAGRLIPVFHAASFLTERVLVVMRDPEEMLKRYESLPGRCGLRAALKGPERIASAIAHAAEVRARGKAERLFPLWDSADDDQILFRLIFQSMGYRPYADSFVSIAQRFTLHKLAPLLDLERSRARDEVLARWFGALNLLKEPDTPYDGDAGEEYSRWSELWQSLHLPVDDFPILKRVGRPWNSPERRLVGLFHHLYQMSPKGWLASWLDILYELDGLRDENRLRKAALQALERAFSTPEDEPWRGRISFRSPPAGKTAQLIGRGRIIIVMANAVIPFFLAYARRRGDKELEKLLYRLFIVLPPEAPNSKTRFMEHRLLLTRPLPATLRSQQGLLQIYQDFCTSFYEGCHACHFPDLIGDPRTH